jgi:hypothetical protein
MDNVKQPTLNELKSYLDEYGWKYKGGFKSPENNNAAYLVSPYTLESGGRGILISFRVEGEFVIVSTVEFLKNIPEKFSKEILNLNDTLKLVKLFNVNEENGGYLDVELGFELWNESWNKETFYSFMDMLCLGIEKTISIVESKKIDHETNFVSFG